MTARSASRTATLIAGLVLAAAVGMATPAPSSHSATSGDQRVARATVNGASVSGAPIATAEFSVHDRVRPPSTPAAGDHDPRRQRIARPEGALTTDDLVVVPGSSPAVGDGPRRTFLVEVQADLDVNRQRFAENVEAILLDPRGWTAGGHHTLQRVGAPPADLRVTLAAPDLVDKLCRPMETNGIYSCWNDGRAMINFWRWQIGASTYKGDLADYRRYLINHEVGHGLGRGHVGCPSAGSPAPIMMQQTISVGACHPNPWP